MRICDEQRIAHFHAYALCVGGWALAASGESEKGLAQISQGGDNYGLGVSQHMLLALQADAQLAIGKSEAALASAAAGLEQVEKMGGAPLEAELYLLRGEALLAGAGTVSEAETAIEKGIEGASEPRMEKARVTKAEASEVCTERAAAEPAVPASAKSDGNSDRPSPAPWVTPIPARCIIRVIPGVILWRIIRIAL